ncbi:MULTISPECIES: type VII secretion protein EssB [Allobacillus]|nr:type VII secretion protein EssB [Allobacillus salarius]
MDEKMNVTTIEMKDLSIDFSIKENDWEVRLAKSQTRIKDSRQIRLLTNAPEESFVPVEVNMEQDAFTFSFFVDSNKLQWEQIRKLHRHEKLRLLGNLSQLKKYIDSRLSFVLHPANIVFDHSLRPYVIYRGMRDSIPPFDLDEEEFLKQLKCFSIAIMSSKYSFDDLYKGEWINAKETEFQKQIVSKDTLEELIQYINESYHKEQEKVDRTEKLLPIKQYNLFRRLSMIFIVISILLAVPLIYIGLVNLPYQENLLDAHEEHLASDHNEVISTLRNEDAADLPQASKYILALAYLAIEPLSDNDRQVITNNISLSTDDNYLLYWIYNGRGKFDAAMNKAKYLDDPQLVMYGLIKQIEKAKNNPNLSGSERDERLKELRRELEEYREEYNLNEDENPLGREAVEPDDDANEDSTNGNTNNQDASDDTP